MTYDILASIDQIQSVTMESDLNVVNTLISYYDKSLIIVEHYEGDDLDAFSVFQEGFFKKKDGDKSSKKGKKKGLLKSLFGATRKLFGIATGSLIALFGIKQLNANKSACESLSEKLKDNRVIKIIDIALNNAKVQIKDKIAAYIKENITDPIQTSVDDKLAKVGDRIDAIAVSLANLWEAFKKSINDFFKYINEHLPDPLKKMMRSNNDTQSKFSKIPEITDKNCYVKDGKAHVPFDYLKTYKLYKDISDKLVSIDVKDFLYNTSEHDGFVDVYKRIGELKNHCYDEKCVVSPSQFNTDFKTICDNIKVFKENNAKICNTLEKAENMMAASVPDKETYVKTDNEIDLYNIKGIHSCLNFYGNTLLKYSVAMEAMRSFINGMAALANAVR